jgi:RNA-directed DNA polymerase
VYIDKADGSKRPLGVPALEDKIVQRATVEVLNAIYEQDFLGFSYGFRPGKSAHNALDAVAVGVGMKKVNFVLDADISKFFDTIEHDWLVKFIEHRVVDARVVRLIKKWLHAGVLEDGRITQSELGTVQGGSISPLLANIYLHPVDVVLGHAGYSIVRYADDLVVLCRSNAEAKAALGLLQATMARRRLTLHPTKTRIADAINEGFEFLGYHFQGGDRWPRTKSQKKLREAIRAHTRRTNGHSMEAIIAQINPILRGWFNYFKHSRRATFSPVDGWVRMRLRSILRKRSGRRGRGHGTDHRRWPNAYFTALGLFTMVEAHTAALQSQ